MPEEILVGPSCKCGLVETTKHYHITYLNALGLRQVMLNELSRLFPPAFSYFYLATTHDQVKQIKYSSC